MGEWDDKNLFSAFMDSWSSIKKVGILISLADSTSPSLVKVPKLSNRPNLSFDLLHYLCNVRMSRCSSLCTFFNCQDIGNFNWLD